MVTIEQSEWLTDLAIRRRSETETTETLKALKPLDEGTVQGLYLFSALGIQK